MISSIVNTLGTGSGIDLAKLVTDLAAASRAPKVARFDTRARTVQSSISAVAQARSDLEGFATSLATLVAGGTLQSQPSVADGSVLEAKVRPGAQMTIFNGEIGVAALARGQTLASAFVASASDPVGQGALTLTIGTTVHAIAIGPASSSLTGISAAINAARTGVTASVISDANGARLILKGPTGAGSAFTMTSADAGLSGLSYPGSATLIQTAQDAAFTVDGVPYSRASNVIDDVLAGVTLTLKKPTVGAPVAIGITRASGALKTTLTDFVSVFNQLKGHLADARASTRGDQGLRAIDRQLSQIVAQGVTSGSPSSLSDIGIKTNRDGTITFDDTVFDTAYAADPAAVEAIFSPVRDATHNITSDPGIGGAMAALKTGATATAGPLNSLSTRLSKEATALADDRGKMETREAAYKTRLEKQFGGVDVRVGALNATQSYLDQQIKLWTASR